MGSGLLLLEIAIEVYKVYTEKKKIGVVNNVV